MVSPCLSTREGSMHDPGTREGKDEDTTTTTTSSSTWYDCIREAFIGTGGPVLRFERLRPAFVEAR